MVNSEETTKENRIVTGVIEDKVARPRTFPQHTLPLLPLLRSRPGGVHKASVVRSPGSDK